MKLPPNLTETEVLAIIEVVSKGLANKFRFGSHEIEDIRQFARMFAIQGLEKYDATLGSLQTFLWSHVHNRLCNLKRDTYERPDKPCYKCPLAAYDPQNLKSTNQCTAFIDKSECELYKKWYDRNSKKRNIINPITIGNVDDENENNMYEEEDIAEKIDIKYIVTTINKKIPNNLRPLWIKLQNDIQIHKADKDKLLAAIHTILTEAGIDVPKAW